MIKQFELRRASWMRKSVRRKSVSNLARRVGTSGARDERARGEDQLNDALEQTFPASDPVSIESTLVPGGRRQ
jgi:hypothetical protein